MELDEILRKLYSRNEIAMLSVINTASHVTIENYDRLDHCVHTGFCCNTHKGKLIGFIYCVTNKELYFQGNSKRLLGTYMRPNESAVFFNDWLVAQASENSNLYRHCISYSINEGTMNVVDPNNIIGTNDGKYIVYAGKNEWWDKFTIIKGKSNIEFPILELEFPIPTFYCGGEHRFKLIK